MKKVSGEVKHAKPPFISREETFMKNKLISNVHWFALALLAVLLAACSTATPDLTNDLEAQAYAPLGGALDSSLGEDAINTSVAVDEFDKPYVAWQESSSFDAYNNNVKYWNGSAWVSLGATDRELENSAGQPALAYSKGDRRLYVAWNEFDYFDQAGNPNNVFHNVYVSFWNGTGWGGLGSAPLDIQVGRNTASPAIALNPADHFHPVVAWQECSSASVPWDDCQDYNIYVKTWDGQFWQSLGGALDKVIANNATEPSVAVGSDGLPVVAWQENGGASGIYPPSQATDIIVKKWNGTNGWVQLGGALEVDPNEIGLVPAVAVNKQNRPVVVWQQTSPFTYTTYAKRWNGTSWVRLGGALDRNINNSAGSPSITMNSGGNPVVSFNEFVNTQHHVYVKRWVPSTSSWVNVGGILDVTSSRDAILSAVGLTSTNKPIVAWQECTDTTWPCTSNYNVYVKELQ